MPNVFVATGFKKWGITNSNVAAHIICDKILGQKNEYEDVFKSTRLKPIKNHQEFANVFKQTVNSLIVDKLKIPKDTVDSIPLNEGKIIDISGQKIGVYKTEFGKLIGIRPVCSHLGCELSWNNLSKTWDCPCHGSIFSFDGKSLSDPSIKNLEKIEFD